MRRIEELHLRRLFYGSLRTRDWLHDEGFAVNRKWVQRLMRQMGITALYPKASTSRPGKGHKIYPYLLRSLVAWAVARLGRQPVIVYSHGEEITTWGSGAKFKAMCFAMNHADRVVANSEYTRGELIRIGVEPERITLIYPGVDIQQFRPGLPAEDLRQGLGLRKGQKLILSVGRLSRRKGFDMVIRSLPRLLDRGLDVCYALVGIGEDRDYLTGLTGELGITDRVHLLGHVSPDDLPRWYNACDVFAMPNREIRGDTEGFGMVFMEAAACARPSLAGKAGGTGTAVVDGVTGLRVDGERVEDVAESLVKLLSDEEYGKTLGHQGHLRAVNEFSWEKVAEKTENL